MRALGRHRVLVCAAFALAVAGFLVSSYRISPSDGVQSRSYEVGSARAVVLVDAPRSPVADFEAGQGIKILAYRAKILADLAMKPLITDTLSARLGVPASVVVADPPSGVVVGPPTAKVAPTDREAYSVRAEAPALDSGDNPIMTIATTAPTPTSAARLADAVIASLDDHLATVSNEQGTPVSRRIQLTQLVPARGTFVRHGPHPAVNAFAALLAFLLVCWLIVRISAVAERSQRIHPRLAA